MPSTVLKSAGIVYNGRSITVSVSLTVSVHESYGATVSTKLVDFSSNSCCVNKWGSSSIRSTERTFLRTRHMHFPTVRVDTLTNVIGVTIGVNGKTVFFSRTSLGPLTPAGRLLFADALISKRLAGEKRTPQISSAIRWLCVRKQ